jgi:hypothetical protein
MNQTFRRNKNYIKNNTQQEGSAILDLKFKEKLSVVLKRSHPKRMFVSKIVAQFLNMFFRVSFLDGI